MRETRPCGPAVLRMILGEQTPGCGQSRNDLRADGRGDLLVLLRHRAHAAGRRRPQPPTVKLLLLTCGIIDVHEIDAFLALDAVPRTRSAPSSTAPTPAWIDDLSSWRIIG